jgi:murein DD-endopeptidase MepM/ murein hydrolase activator NlpD
VAAVPPSAGDTAPQAAATPPAGEGAPPQVAANPPQTAAMGAPPAPAGEQAAAAPPAATGQGTAAPTEMWQAFPPGGAASASQPGSPPQKVSAADLPRVRNPGDPQGAQLLAQRALDVPVAGVQPTALSDNYEQSRGKRTHEATDILAPAGTPVVAVDDGRIAKLFTSKPGGLTIYQYDPQARLAYYYAHLQRYAAGVREGMDVRRGDVICYVGSTGNADTKTPHLHFAVFRLGSPPKWWQGEAVNPYPALSRAQPAQQLAAR